MPSLDALNKAAKSKKASVPKKKPEKKPSTTFSALSSEYVQDSDLEDDEKDPESDDDSLPEDPTDASPKSNGKLPAPDGSSSESENESESEEEDEEQSEDKAPQQSPQSLKPAKKPSKEQEPPTPKAAASQPPAPYKPPAGFESSSIGGAPQAANTFKKSSLEGKQIWYFTAPASVPISKIKETSLLAVKNGEKVCSHDNNDYGFIQDTAEDKTYTNIMVPNNSNDGYKTVSKPIDQILHLQRIVKIPGVDGSDATSSKATVPAKKPVRTQPKGLKMRFLPVGFGTGQPGKIGSDSVDGSASDEETEATPKPFKKPASLPDSSDEDEDEEMTEAPPLPNPKASKHDKSSKKKTETPSSSQSLKRKHSGGDKKSKHSSSQPTPEHIDDDRQLKRQKTKQNDSKADRVSVSTKPVTPIPPPKLVGKSDTPIPPPKSDATPDMLKSILKRPKHDSASSPLKPSKSKTDLQPPPSSAPLSDSKSKKKKKDKHSTPGKEPSLKELTKATDPSLTGEERRKKIKKLKREESSQESQEKKGEL